MEYLRIYEDGSRVQSGPSSGDSVFICYSSDRVFHSRTAVEPFSLGPSAEFHADPVPNAVVVGDDLEAA